MIVKMELILSVDNEPERHMNPQLLKESICAYLKGYVIERNGHTMTINDAGLEGDGKPVTLNISKGRGK